jgi:pimeloyl-ACP methyl ester carboxylesterase
MANLTPGDHFFDADGVTFHYRVGGTSGGPILVAQSVGWGLTGSYLWKGVGPHLERSRTVVYFEPRGNGQSSRPADEATMTSLTMADDLEHLRRHLGLDSIPALWGHSNGACVALRHAQEHPDRVRKLILVNAEIHDAPPPPPPPAEQRGFAVWAEKRKDDPFYASALRGFSRLRADPPRTDEAFVELVDDILPWYLTDPGCLETLKEHVMTGTPGPGVWASLRQGPNDRKGENRCPHVRNGAKVKAGTLVVWGEDDAICDVAEGRAVAEAIPGASLVVFERCGHFPWIEKPEDFWKEVDAFLEG